MNVMERGNSALDDSWRDCLVDNFPKNLYYDLAQMSLVLAEAHLKSVSIKLAGDKRNEEILECIRKAKDYAREFKMPFDNRFLNHRDETAEMYNKIAFRLNRKLGYQRIDYILD